MARQITGAERVVLAPFTAQWPDGRCILAYTRDEHMAIVATVPLPDRPHGDPSLWDVAARHLPTNIVDENEAYGRWLMCSGWGLAVMPTTDGLILTGEKWTVTVDKSAVLKAPAYGSTGVHVGRLKFDDPAVEARSRTLLA